MADDGLLSRLRRRMEAVETKMALAPEDAGKPVFDYLDQQLRSYDLPGKVVTVLVATDRGEINSYGQGIADGNLFRGLNLTIATRGPGMAGHVDSPEIQRLTSFKTGFLVPLNGPGNKYVALVNIHVNPSDPDVVAYQYPKSD